MTSAAFTDILCARSADGDRLRHRRRRGRPARPRLRRTLAAFLVVARATPTFGWRQPAAAVPPVTSPRSLSARRRAASSWNPAPLFLTGLRPLARLRRRTMQRALGRRLRGGGLRRLCRLRSLGGFRSGGFGLGGRLRRGFLGLALLLRLALDHLLLLLLHLFLLARDQLLRLLLLRFARGELLGADDRRGDGLHRLLGRRRRLGLVALDEHALLAHLDLDRARLARGAGRLDLGRLLARERDLLLRLAGGAVLLLQVLEQLGLVLLGQVVAFLLAGDARLAELLQQRPGGILSSVANCSIVVCAMRFSRVLCSLAR